MNIEWKNILTVARVCEDGHINMVTLYIPFKLLPIGAKFRYGYEQDDLIFTKTKKFKEHPEKLVLLDFISYSLTKDKQTFKNRGVFRQLK